MSENNKLQSNSPAETNVTATAPARKFTERKVGGIDNTPITEYHQYDPPKTAGKGTEKVKVIEKGAEYFGKYIFTFLDEEMRDPKTGNCPETHLLKLVDGRKITIKGATGLNRDLALLAKGADVHLIYQGRGKKKSKLMRAPFLWDVSEVTYEDDIKTPTDAEVEPGLAAQMAEAQAQQAEVEETETEELDEEVAF